MISFTGHMVHIEDVLFDYGKPGAVFVNRVFNDLLASLGSSVSSSVNISIKIDGAPAIFAGVDPEDSTFFVAKKSIFNKVPKVYKTETEIDLDTTGDLAVKLKLALKHLSKAGISGIIAGDFLYSKKDLKAETYDGEEYLTFHPNTIVYAVPLNSELVKKIKNSELGIVWHTRYHGTSLSELVPEFGAKISDDLKPSAAVWNIDATLKDLSGTATFTAAETKTIKVLLATAEKLTNRLSKSATDLVTDHLVNERLNIFINTKVRAEEHIKDHNKLALEFIEYFKQYVAKEADKKKTEKGKAGTLARYKNALDQFDKTPLADLILLFNLYVIFHDLKIIFIAKLNKLQHMKSFLMTVDGFEVTNPEGFVAIDHETRASVKLVDRLTFSKANFSSKYIKGFQR